jgi:hypothetical protein
MCYDTESINIGEILKSSSVSFQRISEQDDPFLSSFTTTKIMDMAKPDIQFPADGDEGVIPDAQPSTAAAC